MRPRAWFAGLASERKGSGLRGSVRFEGGGQQRSAYFAFSSLRFAQLCLCCQSSFFSSFRWFRKDQSRPPPPPPPPPPRLHHYWCSRGTSSAMRFVICLPREQTTAHRRTARQIKHGTDC